MKCNTQELRDLARTGDLDESDIQLIRWAADEIDRLQASVDSEHYNNADPQDE